jgi:hypothetical protein
VWGERGRLTVWLGVPNGSVRLYLSGGQAAAGYCFLASGLLGLLLLVPCSFAAVTPGSYVHAPRLEVSRLLLCTTNCPIDRLAYIHAQPVVSHWMGPLRGSQAADTQ